ncbi:MAG: YihY family inner membrane protein [Nitrospirae bacterium]|nr:YihY family inner membrane protein [Nitrospirota bacterium]
MSATGNAVKLKGIFNPGELSVVLVESIKSFIKNNLFMSSAALAYYGIFASIPMLILAALSLVSYFTSSQEAITGLKNITSIVLPDHQDVILTEVNKLSSLKGAWGIIGIVACIWSITPLMSTLRIVFAAIFKETNQRSFFIELAIDVAVVFLFLVLLIALVIAEIIYSQLTSVLFKNIPFLYHMIGISTNLLLSIAVLAALFYVFIPVKTGFWNIFAGVALTSVLWLVVKPSFAYFIVVNPHFGFAFGSLKTILLIILWVYISFFILLAGVEFTANMHRKGVVALKYLIETPHGKNRNALLYKYARQYSASAMVFNDGDKGSEMFYILSGAVQITENGLPINALHEGQTFGEISMLLNSNRTKTAVAIEDNTLLLPINTADFDMLSKYDPQLVTTLLKEMAKKLSRI